MKGFLWGLAGALAVIGAWIVTIYVALRLTDLLLSWMGGHAP